MSRVLITRPEPGAAATAARLRALGHAPVVAPVTRIVALPAVLPEPGTVQAVLVASANALPALSCHRGSKLLAVGDATAAAARDAGHHNIVSAAGDARSLAALAARLCAPAGAPLLLATAEGQGMELVRALAGAGFAVERREVYAARRVEALPGAARDALAGGCLDAALFFSAETARGFVALVREAGLAASTAQLLACAIGQPAADALAPLPWRRIRVALRPNQNEMLALLQ